MMKRIRYIMIVTSLLFLFIPQPCSAGDAPAQDDKGVTLSLRYLPSAFIEYEGEGARNSMNNTWENKVKSHNVVTELELGCELSDISGISVSYLANSPTIDEEKSSSGLQFNDVIMKVDHLSINYLRGLKGSSLKAVLGYQYVRQCFERSNFRLYPPESVKFAAKEVIRAHGVNFGITGRYFSPVYLEFDLITGILLYTDNWQSADVSQLTDKGYTYRVKLESGIDTGSYSAGIGALREMYHPQVKGGASTDEIVYSYSQNKTDLMGFYIFAKVMF